MAVLVYKEEDYWVARALEFDIIGAGKSPEKAIEEMQSNIAGHVKFLKKKGQLNKLIRKSPKSYWDKYYETLKAQINAYEKRIYSKTKSTSSFKSISSKKLTQAKMVEALA